MTTHKNPPRIRVPHDWSWRVKSAMLQVISVSEPHDKFRGVYERSMTDDGQVSEVSDSGRTAAFLPQPRPYAARRIRFLFW